MFNILVPVLAIYFATLVFRKRFKLSALRYLFLGSFMLFYSSAIVILLLVIISLFLNRNYGLKYLPIFLVPYALWVSLNIFYSGSFYDHATKKYRQYIWILDDFQKDNGLAIFADHLQKNLGNFFYTFSDLTLLLNFSIILMFIILFVFLRIPIHSNLITATLKIVSLLLIILWVSLALNSFYAARLNWTLVISLQIGLCLFGIYTMSQLQNLNRSFCGKSISSELIGFLFVSYALIQIGIFCLFDGPFS
jgi:hypothetical protein